MALTDIGDFFIVFVSGGKSILMAAIVSAGLFDFLRDKGEGFDQWCMERVAALFHFLGVF